MSQIDPSAIERLEKIYRLQSKSFVRYAVESAIPDLRDDWDRKAQGLLEAWYRDSQGNLGMLERLLAGVEVAPRQASWPLDFTQYHYVDYFYLLKPVRARMEALLREIEDQARQLSAWPAAQATVKALLDKEKPYIVRAAELEAQRPKAGPQAARRKVSANWW